VEHFDTEAALLPGDRGKLSQHKVILRYILTSHVVVYRRMPKRHLNPYSDIRCKATGVNTERWTEPLLHDKYDGHRCDRNDAEIKDKRYMNID
jgi:hypothetical protein